MPENRNSSVSQWPKERLAVLGKKTLILDGSIGLTGALVSAGEISLALGGNSVLVRPDKGKLPPHFETKFSKVESIPIRQLRKSIKDILLYLPFLILAGLQLRRVVQAHQISTVIVNDFYLIQPCLLRLLGFKGKILTWVRIDPMSYGFMGRSWLFLVKLFSNEVISVSRFIQNRLISAYSLESILLYDAIEESDTEGGPVEVGMTSDFVFIGNYISGKGQDVAIDALARIVDEFSSARIIFYGSDLGRKANSEYLDALRERAIQLGVESSVVFEGFISNPKAALSGKLGALNLSRSESFSRTVLEASAAGLPVIATRCGGPEEIVVHTKTGYLVDLDDATEVASRMKELIQNPGVARELGRLACKHSRSKFSIETFRTELLDLFARSDPNLRAAK